MKPIRLAAFVAASVLLHPFASGQALQADADQLSAEISATEIAARFRPQEGFKTTLNGEDIVIEHDQVQFVVAKDEFVKTPGVADIGCGFVEVAKIATPTVTDRYLDLSGFLAANPGFKFPDETSAATSASPPVLMTASPPQEAPVPTPAPTITVDDPMIVFGPYRRLDYDPGRIARNELLILREAKPASLATAPLLVTMIVPAD